MNILNNYKIIKELGHGMIGTVYMIEYIGDKTKLGLINKNKYALKIENIQKKDINSNKKSESWRELNFYKILGNKFPEQFIRLIDYDFINGCEHSQKYSFDIKLFDKHVQNKLIKKKSSDYCIRKVFDLIDGDLTNLIGKLEHKQIYSMIIQITYSIKLLHNSNYIHGDFHLGNIGWIKTNKKYIILDRIKIKTFGYQFKLIDFGFVLSKFDITNKREEKNYNELINKELGYLLYCFVDNKFLEWFNKNNLKYDFTKLYNQLKKTDEFKIINKFTSNKNDQIFLYDILFQEQYQKIICGNNYKKTIIRKLFIPIQDILVFVKIYQYPDLVIKYFNNKI